MDRLKDRKGRKMERQKDRRLKRQKDRRLKRQKDRKTEMTEGLKRLNRLKRHSKIDRLTD
jgi:hypothetical protein